MTGRQPSSTRLGLSVNLCAVFLMFSASTLSVAQGVGEEVVVDDPRPLAAAAAEFAKRCHCAITYEDVKWTPEQVEISPTPTRPRPDGSPSGAIGVVIRRRSYFAPGSSRRCRSRVQAWRRDEVFAPFSHGTGVLGFHNLTNCWAPRSRALLRQRSVRSSRPFVPRRVHSAERTRVGGDSCDRQLRRHFLPVVRKSARARG